MGEEEKQKQTDLTAIKIEEIQNGPILLLILNCICVITLYKTKLVFSTVLTAEGRKGEISWVIVRISLFPAFL